MNKILHIIIMVIFVVQSGLNQDTTIQKKPKAILERIDVYEDDKKAPEPVSIPMHVNGQRYEAIITEEGDTLLIAPDIAYVSISSMRQFNSDKEYRKYRKQRRYANIVYPYAKEAIRIFRELEYAEQHLGKKEKKKKVKELQDELKSQFEEPLSKLTKLQGKIMIKMIERELDESMYDLIKGLKGRFTAFYWHNFSKLYSYDLKDGYNEGKYPILDAVLQDFDISYKIENNNDLKYVNLKKK